MARDDLVDMNGNGLIDTGDLTMGMARWSPMVLVDSPQVIHDIALSASSANAQVLTIHQTDGVNEGYELEIYLAPNLKRPVQATVTSGPNVAIPQDLGCTKDSQPGRSKMSVFTGAISSGN